MWLATIAAAGAEFQIPESIPQGGTLRISVRDTSRPLTATLGGKTIRLFAQTERSFLGLMPILADQTPGPVTLVIYLGAETLHTATVTVEDAHFPIQDIRTTSRMSALKPLPGEMERIRDFQQTVSETRYWIEPLRAPTPDCRNSPFGVQRYHNGKPTGGYHRGVDLRSPSRRPVKAIAGGVVKISKMYRLHGGTVGIDHGQGLVSIYIHMSRLSVKEGARVRKGQTIGLVGSTGFATGPHLHWGLYANGLPVNPDQWIPARACR